MAEYELTTRKVRSGSRMITKTYFRRILENGIRTGWTQINQKGAKAIKDEYTVTII